MSLRGRDQRGQAVIELALVLGLFFLVITAALQLVWIGSAQIRCHQAARRAAWLLSVNNNLDFDDGKSQIRALLPGYDLQEVSGDRDSGIACTISCTVPAIGFFRLGGRSQFTLRSRSAVIGYNPTPLVSKLVQKGSRNIAEWIATLIKK